MSFVRWTAVFVGTYAVLEAILLVSVGILANLPLRRLWLSYVSLLLVPVVAGPLIHWARLSLSRPRTCACRFSIAVFTSFSVLTAVLALNASELNLTSKAWIFQSFIPSAIAGLVIVTFTMYMTIRRRLESPNHPKSRT